MAPAEEPPAGVEPVAVAEPSLAAFAEPAPVLGDGFVVWESARDGTWGIWTRDLDTIGEGGSGAAGGGPRRLSPEESGRAHCCPHISPDGRWIAYLSLPPGGEKYLPEKSTGPLHVIRPDGTGDRVVAEAARTYFENRGAVWRSSEELIFIDGRGRARLLDLESGKSKKLIDQPRDTFGYLIDPTLSWATTGQPSFSPFQPEQWAVAERSARGGCQPYFSGDGRWGYWVAGAGGPINRLALESGAVSTILRKRDERLHSDFAYLYFPMFSRDGSLFVFGASPGEHDHLKGNYEIFAAESDPETLEMVGPVVRVTDHPGSDRFPDVFVHPLALGRHTGEAPFRAELEPPGAAGAWSWSYGDGSTGDGVTGSHLYREPGSYRVEARRGEETVAGWVRVRPARPPRVVSVELVDGAREVRVAFDEPVSTGRAELAFESGLEKASHSLTPDGRVLKIRLAEPITRGDRLRLAGITDRAEEPNRIAAVTVDVEPPLWPSRRDGLLFVWQTGDSANLIFDPQIGADRASVLEPSGTARFDRDYLMAFGRLAFGRESSGVTALPGGLFSASEEQSNALRWALQATNELTLEAVVTATGSGEPPVPAIHFGEHGRGNNFALIQRGTKWFLSLRTSNRPPTNREIRLAPVTPGTGQHLAIGYSPGRLTLDLDGERVLETDEVQGDFFHWRTWRFTVGGAWGSQVGWEGRLEGLAVYDRVLDPEQARENFLRYRRQIERRSRPDRVVVEVRFEESTPVPTLDEIRPYRQALVVDRYSLVRTVEGTPPDDEPLLVARWGLLDGIRVPPVARPGETAVLRLEPLASQPQLESVYRANAFDGVPAYFAPLE